MENRKVTIQDVARFADVSVATVSRYLQGSSSLSAVMRDRVANAIKMMQYSPNRIAQSLKSGRSFQMMHILPDITNPYYARMYRTVQNFALQHGYSVFLFDTAESKINELKGLELCTNTNMDGLFFCSVHNSKDVLSSLLKINKPVVSTVKYETKHFDTIYSPAGYGLYLAASHLLRLGHIQIAYAGGVSNSNVNIRRRLGYQKALSDSGIQINPKYIIETEFSINGGYISGIYLSSLSPRPTAICCANDMIALGVLQALNEKGINIPDDISLTGEDDIEYVKYCRPGLTTIRNPSATVAEQATAMLLERLEGKYSGPPREIISTRELIIRNSTKEWLNQG